MRIARARITFPIFSSARTVCCVHDARVRACRKILFTLRERPKRAGFLLAFDWMGVLKICIELFSIYSVEQWDWSKHVRIWCFLCLERSGPSAKTPFAPEPGFCSGSPRSPKSIIYGAPEHSGALWSLSLMSPEPSRDINFKFIKKGSQIVQQP